ncbi:pyridoxamine 5'-phosphate oxidase family protein [Granulicella mallensis]|uniref:Pyridoxamine 5'-phosphate oxidase-related FMN-binding protein n=1 Tax=Granulicella mallensis (strain ATCC BAA-1857 / DSM 23137 / MP5ACTX8) TaxID=682795 RepID=G8NYQ7_GRAMM|nr:pyridoxamine 5'-phosphate oxidase family protein [Granulicella mallensis]AEU34470.1 pyridoxamine 5'-phosphate oxidase-related FMN-binding protein [Granulicella mallensis MP5ACTX8]
MSMDPFHEGERRVQRRVGGTEEADRNSPMISPYIPAGAIPFLQQQSLLVLAVLDKGAMWCLPVAGKAGWMAASRDTLYLDLEQTIDPVDERILRAAEDRQLVGGVVLDFATRRRLRVNGRLEKPSDKLMVLSVAEAYPNCPKYITQRALAWSKDAPAHALLEGESLTREQRDAFEKTDVFFIATQHPERGLDASHRGGNPGFVVSPSDRTIRFPDYAGNNLFNTLGNLEIDARVGLLLPDFNNGTALAISGTASVSYEDQGRARWTTVTVQRWTQMRLPVLEKARQLSPFNP